MAVNGLFEGLQIGKVTQIDGDPAKENRIQVKIPVLNSDPKTVWARLANMHGIAESDEVIIGFINNDPENPVILGSLHSNNPPFKLIAESGKTIVGVNGVIVEFEENRNEITIKTPSKNEVVISDAQKIIKLSDQNGNTVTMNDNGIKIDSCKDVIISAKADIRMQGLNIAGNAGVGMTMKGSAMAEFSASGQTTVKGAIVMIN
ncbi:MAG: phage baseplate assembly protein V [Rikenellaceae bacterium]|nr:phage baseplate assembly protein V [Rikenellaceae bacterium]